MANGEGFFNRINGYKLDPELMMGAMQSIDDMDPADRDFEGMTIRIISYIHEATDLEGEDRTDASMAINFRLMALAKLKLPALPEWRIDAPKDGAPDLLHESVIQCAAVEPLVRVGEDLIFDEASFTKRLSAIAPLGEQSRLRQTLERLRG